MQKINVLGTEYTIEIRKISEDEYMRKNNFAGYCAEYSKTIVIADVTEQEYFGEMDENEKEESRKRTLRHELIHAFLNESGLSSDASATSGAWAKHEEMIDWFAIQSPKIYKVFSETGCL